jgi:hypothetical protein
MALSPVELSVLIGAHGPVEPDPCRVCGHDMKMAKMGGGEATEYACASAAADFIRAPVEQRDAAYKHYGRSRQSIVYHGDERVVTALTELRRLREQSGEDMTVPVGARHFPAGHGPNLCWRFLEHRGDDRWVAVTDFDFSHDPSHQREAPAGA